MSEIETELEDFLQKTQNPSAWLMVVAAKTEIERLTLMNAAYKTVIDGATLDTRQKQAEIDRLNARLKVLQYAQIAAVTQDHRNLFKYTDEVNTALWATAIELKRTHLAYKEMNKVK